MQVAIKGHSIYLKELNRTQYDVISQWKHMKWNKSLKMLVGLADIETLDKLHNFTGLPVEFEKKRLKMKKKAHLIDRERLKQKPIPLLKYPVKVSLYEHQVRAANMALLQFEMIDGDSNG